MQCRRHHSYRRSCSVGTIRRLQLGSSRTVVLIALLSPALLGGCRAIRKIGDDGHSIAARRLSREGIKAMHNGQWDVAEDLFGDALEISKSDDRAHRGLAEALWNRNERDAAIAHMEKAVRLSAGDPKLVQRLGRMYFDTGHLDKATQQCEIALSAERNSADIWALRGDCLSEHGQQEEALAAYHRALALQPSYQTVQIQAAEIYRVQGRYDRLLATLDQLESSSNEQAVPGRVDLLRGIAMRELGRHEDARDHFLLALQKDPHSAEPYLHLAAIDVQRNQLASARVAVADAMRLDPGMVRQSGWQSVLQDGGPEHRIALQSAVGELSTETPHETTTGK